MPVVVSAREFAVGHDQVAQVHLCDTRVYFSLLSGRELLLPLIATAVAAVPIGASVGFAAGAVAGAAVDDTLDPLKGETFNGAKGFGMDA